MAYINGTKVITIASGVSGKKTLKYTEDQKDFTLNYNYEYSNGTFTIFIDETFNNKYVLFDLRQIVFNDKIDKRLWTIEIQPNEKVSNCRFHFYCNYGRSASEIIFKTNGTLAYFLDMNASRPAVVNDVMKEKMIIQGAENGKTDMSANYVSFKTQEVSTNYGIQDFKFNVTYDEFQNTTIYVSEIISI